MTLEQLIALGLSEEIAKKVMESYQGKLKEYVPVERFNEVNKAKEQLEIDLKERDKQLKELKTKVAGNEELTLKITELENLNKATKEEYETKMAALKKETAIELKLKDEKAKNIKAVKALLDLEKVSVDGDNLTGLEEQLKSLKESDSYLFGEDFLKGREPNNPGRKVEPEHKNNPWKKETFNLTEQGRITRENPDLAKQLQSAAI